MKLSMVTILLFFRGQMGRWDHLVLKEMSVHLDPMGKTGTTAPQALMVQRYMQLHVVFVAVYVKGRFDI